jgi:hypothetical protein
MGKFIKTPAAMFIPALVAVSAVGLVALAWFVMTDVEQRLQAFDGFEGMHFET